MESGSRGIKVVSLESSPPAAPQRASPGPYDDDYYFDDVSFGKSEAPFLRISRTR